MPTSSSKALSPVAAAALVKDAMTVAVGGTGSGHLVPETILAALESRFLVEGAPRNLRVVHTMGLGDYETSRGIEHFAHAGFVETFFGSHYAANPRLQAMLISGELSAYVLPAGAIAQLYREIAAGRPGLTTTVGRGSFVDPKLQGARSNPSMPGYVRTIDIDGRQFLFYPSFPIDLALIRASVADEDGNLAMVDEPALGDNLAAAQAAHNSRGVVVAQVSQIVARHSLSPREVTVPGCLVDHVVCVPDEPLTYATTRSDAYSGRHRIPSAAVEALPAGPRKLIARRAALALRPGSLVNLGFGVANGIASVLAEEGLSDLVALTVEQGTYGGWPAVGLDAGAAVNHDALIDVPAQFDFYDGGGLDQACLSFAEIDPAGRVNVSRFGDRLTGPGGFIDIAHRAGRVIFVGTLEAGASVDVASDHVEVHRRGHAKLVADLQQVTYDPAQTENSEAPLYVTERAVFELVDGRLTLVEIAPGLSVDDVVGAMAFTPGIAATLHPMPQQLLAPEPGYVREELTRVLTAEANGASDRP